MFNIIFRNNRHEEENTSNLDSTKTTLSMLKMILCSKWKSSVDFYNDEFMSFCLHSKNLWSALLKISYNALTLRETKLFCQFQLTLYTNRMNVGQSTLIPCWWCKGNDNISPLYSLYPNTEKQQS